jgi:peptidoglycan/LPS O-acetylase OafA/YrhL
MRLLTEDALKAALQGLGFTGRLKTAFIERVNLTVRHGVAALARRTWATVQQSPHLLAHLEWWRAYYHFVRPHQSLRMVLVQPREREGRLLAQRYRQRTPAMAAGRTTRRWTTREVLLLFTLLYAAWRGLSRHRPHAAERFGKLPSERAILGFIVALGLVSFVVRIWWPLNWWWQPFSLPVAQLPQYLSFYLLGVIAYRRNWFAELSPRMGRDGWRIALVTLIGFLLMAVLVMTFGGGAGMQRFDAYRGGLHWQALVEAVWEAFLLVGVCLGSLVLFRQRWNRQGRLAKGLAASSYTVYLIHPLVIVSVASAFSAVVLYPLLKFGIAVLIVLPLSFLVALVLRKLPLAKRIL